MFLISICYSMSVSYTWFDNPNGKPIVRLGRKALNPLVHQVESRAA